MMAVIPMTPSLQSKFLQIKWPVCQRILRLHLLIFASVALFVVLPNRAFSQNNDEIASHPLQTEMRQEQSESFLYLPLIHQPTSVLIAGVHIDSTIRYEPDEAILLWNISRVEQPLAGWQIETKSRRITFPLTTTLTIAAGQSIWCTAEAATFRRTFGVEPACEWRTDTDPTLLMLDGDIQLPNSSGLINLRDEDGNLVDALLYGDETTSIFGWHGRPAQIYDRGAIPSSGQIWLRKFHEDGPFPLDSDSASDWSGDLPDMSRGRRVQMPGWRGPWHEDQHDFALVSTLANAKVLVGPEGLYQPIVNIFESATTSIDLSLYTFEHPAIAQVLIAAQQRGVRVRMVLEGSPAGGIDDLQRWCTEQMVNAGVEVLFLAAQEGAPSGLRPRFRFTHAKYVIIDGQSALIGTENFSTNSMPLPDRDRRGGRRGFYLWTDAHNVADSLQTMFEQDWLYGGFFDVRPFDQEDPSYGGPPDDFVMPEPTEWWVKRAPFDDVLELSGEAQFGILSAPEMTLNAEQGILALIGRAGPGDEIYLWQLYEHKYWGESISNPIADPNLRLEALIGAAERGAKVRILLDGFFDNPEALRSNRATVDYVRTLLFQRGIDIDARIGNPTTAGIHAKVVLAKVRGQKWSAIGSLNGGEVSHKLNREVVILTDLAGVYDRVSDVFDWDWALSEPVVAE